MYRYLILLFPILLISCGNKKPSQKNETSKRKKKKQDFASAYKTIGGLKLKGTIKIKTELLHKEKKREGFSQEKSIYEITEEIELTKDKKGNIRGLRNLSSGDGIEFFLSNKKNYCIKFRYEKFTCRETTPEEIEKRTLEIWNTPLEILSPINGFVSWIDKGSEKTEMGTVKLYEPEIIKVRSHPPVKGWRSKSRIISIEGSMKKLEGLMVEAKFKWQLESVNKVGKKIIITVNSEHTVKKYLDILNHPPEKMIMRNGERKRPLRDLKKLLGNSKPENLKYLYGE